MSCRALLEVKVLKTTTYFYKKELVKKCVTFCMENDIGLFVNKELYELPEDNIYLDLSDDFIYSQCEELLVGDNCMIGGRYPTKSLDLRIDIIYSLVEVIINDPAVIGLKLILSETYFELREIGDFETIQCKTSEIVSLLTNAYSAGRGETPDICLIVIK